MLVFWLGKLVAAFWVCDYLSAHTSPLHLVLEIESSSQSSRQVLCPWAASLSLFFVCSKSVIGRSVLLSSLDLSLGFEDSVLPTVSVFVLFSVVGCRAHQMFALRQLQFQPCLQPGLCVLLTLIPDSAQNWGDKSRRMSIRFMFLSPNDDYNSHAL